MKMFLACAVLAIATSAQAAPQPPSKSDADQTQMLRDTKLWLKASPLGTTTADLPPPDASGTIMITTPPAKP